MHYRDECKLNTRQCQRSTKTDPLLTQIRSIKSDPLFHLGMAPERRLSFNR